MSLLYHLEHCFKRVRHSAVLKHAVPIWNLIRPVYNRMLATFGSGGLIRNINGTDKIRLCSECRGIGEIYEPQVWAKVMGHLKPGSRILDVGAHVGLYAIAFGLRIGPTGCVLAAEPDPENLKHLHKHIALNGLKNIVRVVPAGIADAPGSASLSMDNLQSHVSSESGGVKIQIESLDNVTQDERWDLLLIDVEGYEEKVLRGSATLLRDPSRRPTMIMIEVHPYAWAGVGSTSASLLEALTSKGYSVRSLDGATVSEITAYGHIVATPT